MARRKGLQERLVQLIEEYTLLEVRSALTMYEVATRQQVKPVKVSRSRRAVAAVATSTTSSSALPKPECEPSSLTPPSKLAKSVGALYTVGEG